MIIKTVPICLLVAVTIFAAAGPANGQSIRDDIKDSLNRKYAILQQQADTERMRAETERLRAEAEASARQRQTYSSAGRTSGPSQGYAVSVDRDSLAGFEPATYRLGNGLVLQVTGLFQPDAPTVCIANCP